MSQLYKCRVSEETASFHSRADAVAAGWRFVEIVTRERVKYFVLAPDQYPQWLAVALGDKGGKR